VVEKTTENIVGREAESTLEKGRKHHNLFGVGCSDVFPFSRMPLEHRAIREEAVLNQFEDLAFIHDRLLEQTWMRDGHGEGKENLRRRFKGTRGGSEVHMEG
jgi:hypothetical protein